LEQKFVRNPQFNEQILAEARQRYGISGQTTSKSWADLKASSMAMRRMASEYVLRLGHSLRRSPNLIRGEVDWINHLARGGAGRSPGHQFRIGKPG
jgi:hypothetical protein